MLICHNLSTSKPLISFTNFSPGKHASWVVVCDDIVVKLIDRAYRGELKHFEWAKQPTSVVSGLTFCILGCFDDMKLDTKLLWNKFFNINSNDKQLFGKKRLSATVQEDFGNTTLGHGNYLKYFSEVRMLTLTRILFQAFFSWINKFHHSHFPEDVFHDPGRHRPLRCWMSFLHYISAHNCSWSRFPWTSMLKETRDIAIPKYSQTFHKTL